MCSTVPVVPGCMGGPCVRAKGLCERIALFAQCSGPILCPSRTRDHGLCEQPQAGAQVEYHYLLDSAVSRPPAMLAVLQGLKRRGLRAFSAEPNIWGANSGHDILEYAYIQARPAWHCTGKCCA